MNSFITAFRAQNPNYPSSDEDLVLEYGDLYPPSEYEYPEDFVKDYTRLSQARAVSQSSAATELGRGVKRGITGLESTGAGALALASSVVGAEGAKEFWQDIYRRKVKQMAEEAPATVPKLEQAGQSLSAAGQYIAGKVGELVPNIAEAGVMALAGTMAAPGPGTEAGAAGGLFARAAARTAIRKAVERTMTPALRKELEEYAAGKIAGDALSETATKVITDASKYSKYLGGTTASALNFAGQGAGGAYGELSDRPGVTEGGARSGALIAGAGASVGALIPAQILKGIFGESVGVEAARSYVDLFAKKIPQEILTAGGGMGAMEFFNILGEKYADPKKRDEPFSKEDYSRLLNSIAVGVMASAPAVALTAVRGVKPETPDAKPAEASEPEATKPQPAREAPAPGMTPGEVATNFPVEISKEQDLILHQVANASARNALTDADQAYLNSLPAPVRARYETIKLEVSNALESRQKQEGVRQQREGTDGLVQTKGKDREQPAQVKEESPQASVSDSLQQAAGELSQETKAVLKTVGIDADAAQEALRTAAQVDDSFGTPVDVFRQKARAQALEKPEPAAETEVKPKAAEAPPTAPPAPAAKEVSIPEIARPSIEAFKTPRTGKVKEEFYTDIGRNPDDKNASKALGVFEAPDGKIVVATLYNNRGEKVSLPSNEKSWDSALKRGYKPIGHIRTGEPQKGFYRELSKAEWADIQKQLEGKVREARSAVASPISEEAAGTKSTATGAVTPEGITVAEKG